LSGARLAAARGRRREGFTLIEIVIAVAVVAIMAGVVTPLVYRELERAREDATLAELETLRTGLLEFYEDTGRLPSEAEGLTALVADPGVDGWQGPYVAGDRGDPVTEVTTDAWSGVYLYDLSPVTVPAGAADLVVASAGGDGAVDDGAVGGTWTVTAGNDLLALVTVGPVNRDKLREAAAELDVLARAAARYFEDHAAFPNDTDDLTDEYLDPGQDADAFTDPWRNAYTLTEDLGGANPPDLVIASFGPDRGDDGGGGDDLTVNVSSTPPGRRATLYLLEIAQNALNLDTGLSLSGNWTGADRAALSLATAFDTDGWGQDFRINVASRTVFSSGPDGDPDTQSDNIPQGVGPN
jgi:general secretion pathway protein G